MTDRFVDQSLANCLFKLDFFFHYYFLHITALSCHMSHFGTVLPSTNYQKYLLQNTVISHIGKTFYYSVTHFQY